MNTRTTSAQLAPPSDWVARWTKLIPTDGTVLDVACGRGRHMKWFHEQKIRVVGIDRDPEALKAARNWGEVRQADIESAGWPLQTEFSDYRQFEAVVVTNYLWRPLFPSLLASVAEGGVFIYETFAQGNEVFGKPSRPDFLLRPGELLDICHQGLGFQVVAYESGILKSPDRCVQRLAAIKVSRVAKEQQSEVQSERSNPAIWAQKAAQL